MGITCIIEGKVKGPIGREKASANKPIKIMEYKIISTSRPYQKNIKPALLHVAKSLACEEAVEA